MITDVWRNLLRLAWKTAATDTAIKYIAWGNSTTAPAAGDIKLGNELGRKAVTAQNVGGTGVLDTIGYLAPADAVTTIEEIGFFGGATATGAADSGTMVNHFLYHKVKTNLIAIQHALTDSVTEG